MVFASVLGPARVPSPTFPSARDYQHALSFFRAINEAKIHHQQSLVLVFSEAQLESLERVLTAHFPHHRMKTEVNEGGVQVLYSHQSPINFLWLNIAFNVREGQPPVLASTRIGFWHLNAARSRKLVEWLLQRFRQQTLDALMSCAYAMEGNAEELRLELSIEACLEL